MQKIKKGDDVIVMTGKDKGRRGSVLRIMENGRVLVEGINMVKKHQKPNPNAGVQGGIIDKEMPVHASNVMVFNPITEKGDKVGVKTLEDGRRVRFYRWATLSPHWFPSASDLGGWATSPILNSRDGRRTRSSE